MEIGEIRYATSTGGIDIAFQEFGPPDAPKLVWVSGFISHLDFNWDFPPMGDTLRAFGSACRVIAFDKRGTGLSDRNLGFGSLAERADDIRAVMDAAGWDRASLLGISEGGPMSILFAATSPERVETLSLYGTGARFTAAPDYPEGNPNDPSLFYEHLESNWGTGNVLVDPIFVHSDDAPPGLAARFERNACTPKVVVEIMRRNLAIDVRELLPSLTVPTLVVHATEDPFVPVALARYLARHIEGARLVEVPRRMHGSWHADDMEAVVSPIVEFVTGSPARTTSERVLATVLFTDIVGSTERAAALGDRKWRALLDVHDRECARLVSRFGGVLVKQTGDGMLATFDGPARAVQCAHALDAVLRDAGLPTRAGIHTGEIERRGDDVGGIAVHIAARVAALADADEVLVSRTVRDLVVGSDLRFEDRGTHELKGVPDTWQIYEALR